VLLSQKVLKFLTKTRSFNLRSGTPQSMSLSKIDLISSLSTGGKTTAAKKFSTRGVLATIKEISKLLLHTPGRYGLWKDLPGTWFVRSLSTRLRLMSALILLFKKI